MFIRAIYRGVTFSEYYTNLHLFFSHFAELLPETSSILIKYVNIVNNSTVILLRRPNDWNGIKSKRYKKEFEWQNLKLMISI